MENNKTIYKKLALLFTILLIIILVNYIGSNYSKRNFEKESYYGKIVSIRYSDKDVIIVKLNIKNFKAEIVLPARKGEVTLGDSISKKKNENYVKIYRNGKFKKMI